MESARTECYKNTAKRGQDERGKKEKQKENLGGEENKDRFWLQFVRHQPIQEFRRNFATKARTCQCTHSSSSKQERLCRGRQDGKSFLKSE